ncbi:hypothetical protein BDD12DRAFT_984459 [Trichophaea hybrida]|nr:hypothetical protein BDD12DRAFT_984459 [Trichophaea hybrida]
MPEITSFQRRKVERQWRPSQDWEISTGYVVNPLTIDEIISYLRTRPLKDADEVASVFVTTFNGRHNAVVVTTNTSNAWCHTTAAAAFLDVVIKAPRERELELQQQPMSHLGVPECALTGFQRLPDCLWGQLNAALCECVWEKQMSGPKNIDPSMHNVPIREENASRADDLPRSE